MIGLWRGQGWARRLLIAGWILCVLAPLMIIAAIVGIVNEQHFLNTASKAEGTVVEMVERKADNGTAYAPVYVFNDAVGHEQKVYSRWSSYPPAYRVGEKIRVIYNPHAPQDAQIEGFFDMWGWMMIVGVIGLVYAVIGPVLVLFGRRRQKRESVNETGK
jgi:Protein of unknown function (DUF3592)